MMLYTVLDLNEETTSKICNASYMCLNVINVHADLNCEYVYRYIRLGQDPKSTPHIVDQC